jgi:integrase
VLRVKPNQDKTCNAVTLVTIKKRPLVKIEYRKNRKGSHYYSFVFYDAAARRTRRLSKEEVRKRVGHDITEYAEAVEFRDMLEAQTGSQHERLKANLQWASEFYHFDKLLALYELHQKKKAPNSYKNNIHYLKHYVLPFFLTKEKCKHISLWCHSYEEFKEWLEDDARLITKPDRKISYASKNHAIKALNTFMDLMVKKKFLNQYVGCTMFPEQNLREKGVKDLIEPQEMETLYQALIRQGARREAIFLRCLYFTGMRFNEALGVQPGNLYEGQIEDQTLAMHLAQEKITYFGYLVIDSQPAHSNRGLRGKDGLILRKPLKGRKRIDDKSARTLVITDKVLWNELVTLHNGILLQHEKRLFGSDISQYPLFEGMDKSTARMRLYRAYEACGLTYRSWHCCRHTRATLLIGETGNSVLAKLWLGHSSERVLNRYVHTYEAMTRAIKKKGAVGGIRPLQIRI